MAHKQKEKIQQRKATSRIADGIAMLLIFGLLDLILFGVFGASGKFVADFFVGVFGYSIYGLSLAFTLFGLLRICNLKIKQSPKIILLYIAIIILMITFAHIYSSHQLTDNGWQNYIVESYNQANTAGGVILSCLLYLFALKNIYIISLVANGVFLLGLIIIAILLQINVDINVERFAHKKRGRMSNGQNANVGMFDVDYVGNASAVTLYNQTIDGRDLGDKIIGSRNSLESYVPLDRVDVQAQEDNQNFDNGYTEDAQLILDTSEIAREAHKEEYMYENSQQNSTIDITQAQRDIFGVDDISSMNVINEGKQDKPIDQILNNPKPVDNSQYNSFSTNERMRIIQENNRRSRERNQNKDMFDNSNSIASNDNSFGENSFAQKLNSILSKQPKTEETEESRSFDIDDNQISLDKNEFFNNSIASDDSRENSVVEEKPQEIVEDKTQRQQEQSMDDFFANLNKEKKQDNQPKFNNYNVNMSNVNEQKQPSDGYFSKQQTPKPAFQKPDFSANFAVNNNDNKINQSADNQDNSSQNQQNEVVAKTPYVAPSIENLKDYDSLNGQPEDDYKEKVRIIEETYANFGIEVSVKRVVSGPTLTRYEFEIPATLSVEKIPQKKLNLMMALEVKSLRIEAPIPGKSLCGIEIPNKSRKIVGLKEFLVKDEFKNFKDGLYFALGKDIDGNCMYADLSDFPHALIAGGTGSGKSICLNTMLISLVYKYSPEQLRIVLVDPKRVEFGKFKQLPHLLTPQIYNTPKEAISILKWLVDEMTRRYAMLESQFVNNIGSYNKIEGIEKMPYILTVLDEVGDIMVSEHAKEFETLVLALTQKARAAGIHLILATQRPSADIITGTIKANLATRIAFAVTSGINSKIILESLGAEDLLGKGDMLYANSKSRFIQRLQNPFIDESEVRNIMIDITKNNQAYYDPAILEQIKLIQEPPKPEEPINPKSIKEFDFPDDLCPDVLRRIVNMDNVTISSLQRAFTIGFPRGGKIFDWLMACGYIEKNGNKQICTLTREQVEEIIENARNVQE